ncbi:hypothetical protein HMPREF1013_03749 [Bacillus sp. 2_A_57_CT2]|nr:hypothetical protein HMPREF1013_03749 [Bacillus sp. 2_A_57_CT2]
MRKIKLLLAITMITVLPIFLSACQAQGGEGTGFFHHYFVDPFALAIHGTAVFFHGNFGLAIIFITIMIRLILMPLMLKQYKKSKLNERKNG